MRKGSDYHSILQTATETAQDAGRMVRDVFPRTHVDEVDWKGPVNPVTEIDLQAERLIVGRIREAFPDHRILAEEGGGTEWSAPGPPIWMVDPVDGTNNLVHGFPHVGISLALVDGGSPVVGVVCDPLREETFAAAVGGGATLNGEPIRVSAVSELARAFLATGFPYDRSEETDNNLANLSRFILSVRGIRRGGSAELDLAYVACGRLDGFWELGLKTWDVAAGGLIVQAAGGTVTNFGGDSWDHRRGDIVASNGRIHAEMLDLVG